MEGEKRREEKRREEKRREEKRKGSKKESGEERGKREKGGKGGERGKRGENLCLQPKTRRAIYSLGILGSCFEKISFGMGVRGRERR